MIRNIKVTKLYRILGALLMLLIGAVSVARADLASYLNKPEPVYHWELLSQKAAEGGTVYDLHLISQVWQGITWEHRLQIFKPDNLPHPEFCTLLNTGGNGGDRETQMGLTVSKGSGTLFAILYNIPNQPLYGGKTEDALIVYTWMKYLQTGDESWPLHFPMAKSVLKAMDAIQEFSKAQKLTPVTGFLITGASKRGWTTWLTGASRDPRVKAIAPMVIDTLNLPAQMPHQREAYGGFSEQIGDYTAVDIQKQFNTPRGKRLVELEDPYSYRNILTLPKMIILGTNDRYWAQDALNLYWDGLKGQKSVLYTPNSGHGLEDHDRVLSTLAAFAASTAGKTAWPKLHWRYKETATGIELTLGSDIAPTSARLFRTYSSSKDFRESHWSSEPITAAGNNFTGTLANPSSGNAAVFGEATYTIDGRTFTLSTQLRILSAK